MAVRKDQLRQVTAAPKSPRLSGSRRAVSTSSNAPLADLSSINAIAVFDSDSGRKEATGATWSENVESSKRNERSWREKLFGRKREESDHNV